MRGLRSWYGAVFSISVSTNPTLIAQLILINQFIITSYHNCQFTLTKSTVLSQVRLATAINAMEYLKCLLDLITCYIVDTVVNIYLKFL